MRTPAEAKKPVPPRQAKVPPASADNRRGRVRTTLETEAPAKTAASDPQPVAVTAVRMVRLEEGLYALRVGEIGGAAGEISGMTLPAAQVCAPFAEDGGGVEIVASFPQRGSWLGQQGGTVIVRSSQGGGYVIVTAYGQPGQAAIPLTLDLRRLDGPPNAESEETDRVPASGAALSPRQGRDIPAEILLHIERAGDRLFPARGWVGALGRKLRIEAFSLRPLEQLAPTDIEFKGFLPSGGETQWVQGGALCGTRGRRLPLTGFAVRLAPRVAGQFDVVYQGSFFAGGISSQYRNGQPCRAATADDPLEAINIRILERAADLATAPPGGRHEP